MEFGFDVRSILMDEISKIDNSLIIKGWNSKTRFRVEYQQLYQIINAIGEASAFAQSLNNVITTSEKLQNSDHTLYLMKEDDPNSQLTQVVGMLKIGRKKLFLLDADQQVKEVAPLCILDFYVHESRQRRGYGRRLFEYMLTDQGVEAGHMAIDKPSDKLLSFLKKHYSLQKQVPQNNNFVVFQSFFDDRPISSEEQQMTAVNRSRGGSRTGSCANSRTGSRTGSRAVSPELPGTPTTTSPSASRRQNNGTPASNSPAGRPTHGPRHSSMADILHGRQDRHSPAAHKNPRYQPTLDWMKAEDRDSPYYSRTPSNQGSPISRTPLAASPPATPPSKPAVEGSIAPTPVTSPCRTPAAVEKAEVNGREEPEEVQREEEEEGGEGVQEEGQGEEEEGDAVDGVTEELENTSLVTAPPIEGKTGGWRDSISRNSEGLIKHLASPTNEGTSVGVLKDDDSVHGHLKFHHHKLW